MAVIKVIPSVIIHRVLNGGGLTGVAPTGVSYSFDYDNEGSGPFTLGEPLSWTGGTGILSTLVDDGATGSMVILLSTGVSPSDGLTITGTSSSATCDVDGDVTTVNYSDSEETIRRGRYRVFSGLEDGGLIDIPETIARNGYSIKTVLVNIPTLTAVNFNIIDRDGNSVNAGYVTLTTGVGYKEWLNGGVIVPPDCKFQVVGTGSVTSDGQIMFVLGEGWGTSMFDAAPQLGASNLPPGPYTS
jgi:hypothetical protein